MKANLLRSLLESVPNDSKIYFKPTEETEIGDESEVNIFLFNSVTNEVVLSFDCPANYNELY